MTTQDYITLDTEISQHITSDMAWHYRVVPKAIDEHSAVLYTDAEQDNWESVIQELMIILGKEISLESITNSQLQKTLSKYYRKSGNNSTAVIINNRNSDSFLFDLIQEAKGLGSSDIHIEVYEDHARIRIRIDGHLVEKYKLEKEDYPELVNKIKITSRLDIAEKRLPQDGRISFEQGEEKFDIRVSVLPTLHGEKIVMRILSNDATNVHIDALGFSKNELERYLQGIKRPNGILLISGPTGSGKTTTLYATLKVLNEEKRNIVTVEDPIEYTLEGINQVQLKEDIGLTFTSALRSFLRQDPDIIMLGEIRDGKTAEMAIRAALTGHLVLSTIHTNSAWGTVSRLIDMGVPPFLLSNTLNTSVAQRLVRKLCPSCKAKESVKLQDVPRNFQNEWPLQEHYVPVGCEDCHYTGYKGRIAVYEVIDIDNAISGHIKNNTFDINEELKSRNISTLAENAIAKYMQGETSLEEIYPILISSD